MPKISELKKEGQRIRRAGLSGLVELFVSEYKENPTPENAIILAGKLSVIADAATYDIHYGAKAGIGKDRGFCALKRYQKYENS